MWSVCGGLPPLMEPGSMHQGGPAQGRRNFGAGGRYPSERCGRTVLESLRQRSISTLASSRVSNTSRTRSSSHSFPLKLSAYPFSQGDPGSMESVFTPTRSSHSRTRFAVNSLPLSADVVRHTLVREQVAQPLQEVLTRQLPRHVDCEAFPCELAHDRQHSECSAVRSITKS
jgi:hypothetical protein